MNELMHFGIKGMRWGVRRFQNDDGSLTNAGRVRYSSSEKKAIRSAKKDAKRYLDAKMYYGEGAGTRRKLLKAELDKKMKDPFYKKHFDEAVANGDLVRSANKARAERKTRDTAHRIAVGGRSVARIITGGSSSILAVGVVAYNASPKFRSKVNGIVNRIADGAKKKR